MAELAMLGWNDLCGLTRTRAVPLAGFDRVRAKGVGWAAAGQCITPFGGIADNPWGPMEEVRQVPVEAFARLPAAGEWPSFNLWLTQGLAEDGGPSDTCPRQFCAGALRALHEATGWTLCSAFEHEFTLHRPGFIAGPAYTVDAFRRAAGFIDAAAAALVAAELDLGVIEPEFGSAQYEVSCGPAAGLAGPDRALLTREVLREVARRTSWGFSVSPKFAPGAVGNGQHIHFSFLDASGAPALPDPASPSLICAQAGAFAAGVLRHAAALCAITAPAPVSYLRLGPSHWSCGFASFGVQNREAALRVCPAADGAASGLNLEFRPPDGLSNPYLAIGALALAGLAGVREGLVTPPILRSDPGEMSAGQREALGIRPLPATLGDALAALEGETWLPARLQANFLSLKRAEIAHVSAFSDAEICAAYAAIY